MHFLRGSVWQVWYFRDFRTGICLSINLNTQVLKTEELRLSKSIKLAYETLHIMPMKVPKNHGVGKQQVLFLYSRNLKLCMGPSNLRTIVPKSISIIFPHLKRIRLLCIHHICSTQLGYSPREITYVRWAGNNCICPSINIVYRSKSGKDLL